MKINSGIIKELTLTQTANEFATFIGIDNLDQCLDHEHFISYDKTIFYQFNQYGYRDTEWPDDTKNSIWCIGDSFTVGLGQPFEEIWPQIIKNKTNCHTINISMNGASNDWIARRARFIIEHFLPSTILIQWSYIHRRESTDHSLIDEDRALWYTNKHNDHENFIKNIMSVERIKQETKIIHSFIPEFCQKFQEDTLYSILKTNNVLFFPAYFKMDLARDGHHYDVLTATAYADSYIELLNE